MATNKKALIVSPYLDHLGGGERYMLTVAQVLETLGYTIFFAWDNLKEIDNLSAMLGIKLVAPKLDNAVKSLYESRNPLSMFWATKKYDVVIYLSDGSIPLLGSKKNIIHMQVPFHDVGGRNWKNILKKRFIDEVIVNSRFTKRIVDQEFDIDSRVVYPPVSVKPRKSSKKKLILSVGRFEPSLNAKKQDVLIKAFKQIYHKLPGWQLVLAGASASDKWVTELKGLIWQAPIRLAVNVSYEELSGLYSEASIYWHGAGYQVDENKNPELVEHFGITTVEAIANGCVPLVVPYGGQREIVTNPELHWETIDELASKTISLCRRQDRASLTSDIKVETYNDQAFKKAIEDIL